MKTRTIVAGFAAAAFFVACGGVQSHVASNVPNLFDKPLTVGERGRLDATRARIDNALATGMNFRVSGTASTVLVVHDIPAVIVLGRGNIVRTELVKANAPQFALSVRNSSSQARRAAVDQTYIGGEGDAGGGGSTPSP
jgi:hypothetical protein